MAEDRPQIYLISPSDPDPELFADRLARVLDTVGIACVRLVTTTRDEMRIGRAADALRAVAHERDVAIVIETHFRMAERHGLDGVHLSDGARSLREARKLLGPDAIVGAFCGASRHEGMTAGEAGADYVSFGPVGTSALGSGATAEQALVNVLLRKRSVARSFRLLDGYREWFNENLEFMTDFSHRYGKAMRFFKDPSPSAEMP